jgi:hypothetical protein
MIESLTTALLAGTNDKRVLGSVNFEEVAKGRRRPSFDYWFSEAFSSSMT